MPDHSTDLREKQLPKPPNSEVLTSPSAAGTHKRRRRKRGRGRECKAESFRDVLGRSKSAATTYLALQLIAKGKRQCNTTRKTISSVCGLHKDTVTKAVHALQDAGWIVLNYGRADTGHKTWYRITFPQCEFLPEMEKPGQRGRSQNGKKRSQGSRPCGGKTRSPLLEKRGGPTAPPSPLHEEGGAAPSGPEVHWVDRLIAQRRAEEVARAEALAQGPALPAASSGNPFGESDSEEV
jgi:hypothetical protein